MLKRFGVALLAFLLQFGCLFAAGWWEKSHYTRWSKDEVEAILNGSPWTSLIFVGHLKSKALSEAFHSDRIFFRMRLVSAKPIREALLRKGWLRQPVIGLDDLKKAEKTGHGALDTKLEGDTPYIIFTVTLRVITYQGWDEYTDQESLSDSNVSSLAANAFLTTNSGKRVPLVKYEPPSSDGLGAKLYFPRMLPDGTPLVSERDREIKFETQVNNKPTSAIFDLKRMKYQGKLEI